MNDKAIAFGIDFFRGDKLEVFNYIENHRNSDFSYIVTSNVNHIVKLNHDKLLRQYYDASSLVLCDSRILFPVLNRVLEKKIQEVIPGSDLTVDVFENIIISDDILLIIGCDEATIQTLRKKYPEFNIFHYNPPMGFINKSGEVSKVLSYIDSVDFDFIFFAVGCPRQEELAYLVHKKLSKRGVGFCIGASIQFMTGTLKRSPTLIQKLHLEWLHRMFSEPGRLVTRYIGDGLKIVPIFIKEMRK
jgi:N-acetylglucosaminyldiphosphoundecaprenol N-acetyl-beta-D-mannosaminyltransferase